MVRNGTITTGIQMNEPFRDCVTCCNAAGSRHPAVLRSPPQQSQSLALGRPHGRGLCARAGVAASA